VLLPRVDRAQEQWFKNLMLQFRHLKKTLDLLVEARVKFFNLPMLALETMDCFLQIRGALLPHHDREQDPLLEALVCLPARLQYGFHGASQPHIRHVWQTFGEALKRVADLRLQHVVGSQSLVKIGSCDWRDFLTSALQKENSSF
jgi:hypothetical protein